MAYTPALKRAIDKWRKKNKEKYNAYSKDWKEKNNWKAYYKEWQEKNRDKIQGYNEKARLKNKAKKLWQKQIVK